MNRPYNEFKSDLYKLNPPETHFEGDINYVNAHLVITNNHSNELIGYLIDKYPCLFQNIFA